jgi:hypothetical protein
MTVSRSSSERFDRLERRVERLAAELRVLRKATLSSADAEVRFALRRRGLHWRESRAAGCLLPAGARARVAYRELLRRYSFRLFLRDVIRHRHGFGVDDLVRYCSPATARLYLDWLLRHRMVTSRAGRYVLHAEVSSFGPTLEWFVAAALRDDLGLASAANVRLEGAPGGGDFDVIGIGPEGCVYVELKSSPPRNIDAAQVRAFLRRVDVLRPHVAIFLNDTQLRMADKIVPLVAAELATRAAPATVRRLCGEIFELTDGLFVANSDPDLVGNITACLARALRAPAQHPA